MLCSTGTGTAAGAGHGAAGAGTDGAATAGAGRGSAGAGGASGDATKASLMTPKHSSSISGVCETSDIREQAVVTVPSDRSKITARTPCCGQTIASP